MREASHKLATVSSAGTKLAVSMSYGCHMHLELAQVSARGE